MPKAWIHPLQDEDLDHSKLMLADPEDPRTMGEGPCGDLHQYDYINRTEYQQVEAEMKAANTKIEYHGNNQCRYAECSVCALRLAYWPRVGAVCTCINKANPEVVRRTLGLIQEWQLTNCRAVIFRKAYKQIQYCLSEEAKRLMQERASVRLTPKNRARRSNRATSPRRATSPSRATSSFHPTAETVPVDSDGDDVEKVQEMVEFINARRWANVAKKLLTLARRYEYEQVRRFMDDTSAGVVAISAADNVDDVYQTWRVWREHLIQNPDWDMAPIQ